MRLRVLSWNLFHGRDFPPDPALRTWRSRLLRIEEENATHRQVNRDLLGEFTKVLAGAEWDIACLQECPPRWTKALAKDCDAAAMVGMTSRNSLGGIRALLARQNPDLVASNEGGCNLTLSRLGGFDESRVFSIREGTHPERRVVSLMRLGGGVCVANIHASTADDLAAEDVLLAAECAIKWAGGDSLILAGDFNVRPADANLFATLGDQFGFSQPSEPKSIDHILARGLEVIEPAISWPPEQREVSDEGLAIRLSDHAPVSAVLRSPA